MSAWGVVVPVKRLAVAKTRLAGLADHERRELAVCFALDVVAALQQCPVVTAVLVVTDDPRVAAATGALGAAVTADLPDAGLNPALDHGAALLLDGHPGIGVATVSADLPALRPDEFTAALDAVPAQGRGFVPDDEGSGTTVLAARPGQRLGPHFGAGSAGRHRDSGAVELPAGPSLRRDVDTVEDLDRAAALGLGSRTAAAWLRLRSRPLRQGTVQDFDTATRSGTVLLDDGRQLSFPPGAVDAGVRLLRSGQRVALALSDGAVLRVGAPT